MATRAAAISKIAKTANLAATVRTSNFLGVVNLVVRFPIAISSGASVGPRKAGHKSYTWPMPPSCQPTSAQWELDAVLVRSALDLFRSLFACHIFSQILISMPLECCYALPNTLQARVVQTAKAAQTAQIAQTVSAAATVLGWSEESH